MLNIDHRYLKIEEILPIWDNTLKKHFFSRFFSLCFVFTEAFSKPCQTSKMKFFNKIVND